MNQDIRNTFAERLKSARKMASMSMDELCRKSGGIVSKQSISKYERGQMMPDSTVLLSLAKALNRDVDFFFRPIKATDNNFALSFRKKAKLGIQNKNAITEKVKDIAERYMEIEEILDTIRPVKLPRSERVIKEPKDMIELAVSIRKKWELGKDAISSVQAVLENQGIKVIYLDAPETFDGANGYLDDKYPIIIINKNINCSERRRMTMMHELGHLLCENKFSESLLDKDKENLCTIFANEMLLPGDSLVALVGKSRKDISLNELIPIQRNYGISIDAIMIKARDLNIISEERCSTYFKKKNFSQSFKKEAEESRFEEPECERFSALVYRALALDLITTSKAASLLGESVSDVRNNLCLV